MTRFSRFCLAASALLLLTAPLLAQSTAKAAKESRAETIAAAKKIDQFIQAGYEKHKVKPQPIVNDPLFMRRAFLDIIGRNPTVDEIKAFSTIRDRKKLVDALLDSEGYVHHSYGYWADLLRLRNNLAPNVDGQAYIQYVKTAIRENKPYDKFIHEMLSAKGRYIENPATGYLLRDEGMPLDNLAQSLRLFLGTSIGCAQCHDHPFDKWTQLEFYEMSAYVYGVEYRNHGVIPKGKPGEWNLAIKAMNVDPGVEIGASLLIGANIFGIDDNPKREIQLPDDYKYDDAKPGQTVKPMTIFGSEAKVEGDITPRQAFANWVASRENPRFALNAANRAWKRVMGVGLIEPIDEITDKSVASHPELLKFLTEQMLAMNFNIKEFLRVLYYTDTYQRGALTNDLGPTEVYVFQGRLVRRLSGEQMWDCMVTLAARDIDKLTPEITVGPVDIADKTAEEIVGIIQNRRGGNMMMMSSAGKNSIPANLSPMGPGIVRAAVLPSPAPAGHFIRQFGQSDREQIDASTTAPSISQVLNLLNGEIDSIVLNPNSHLVKTLAGMKNNADKATYIFLAVIGRPPVPGELQLAVNEISRKDDKGIANLVWALLNTREFMFVH